MEEHSSDTIDTEHTLDAADGLLAEYKAVRAQSQRIRLLFLVLFLLATSIPVGRIVLQSKSFATMRSDEVLAKTGEKLIPLSRKYSGKMLASLDRIGPTVIAAFMKQINKDYPRLHQQFIQEISQVGAHAQLKWPDIEDHLEALIRSQEEVLLDNLKETIGDSMSAESLEDMIREYQKNLLGNANVYWIQVYLGHAQATRELENSIHMLEKQEPQLAREVSPLEALGIFFEFYGRELQTEARGLDTKGGA